MSGGDHDECLPEYASNRTGLESFSCWYSDIHGYISLLVCAFGILANVINVLILTRKNMRTSTNCLLTGLAISDMLTMIFYAPHVYHFHLQYGTKDSVERNTKDWMSFKLLTINFVATTHTISIWLGVVLAIFRYIFIRLSTEGAVTCSMARAQLAVVLVYITACLICVPNYCSMSIRESYNEDQNATYWVLNTNNTSPVLMDINLWTYAILAKLMPCLLMTVFGSLLLNSLREVKKKGTLLHANGRQSDAYRVRMKEHSRTTRMLVCVITLFLVVELPQGLLLLISILKRSVFSSVYSPLGDLMDDLALINNSINLIIYSAMSKSFRDNFIWLFCGWWRRKQDVLFLINKDKTTTREETYL